MDKKIEKIREKILTIEGIDALKVMDQSHLHVGHAGYREGESTHFDLKITSKVLYSMSKIEAHRQIYAALGGMMVEEIHALSIDIAEM